VVCGVFLWQWVAGWLALGFIYDGVVGLFVGPDLS